MYFRHSLQCHFGDTHNYYMSNNKGSVYRSTTVLQVPTERQSFLPNSEAFAISTSCVTAGSAFDLRNIHLQTDQTSGINHLNAFPWVKKMISVLRWGIVLQWTLYVTNLCPQKNTSFYYLIKWRGVENVWGKNQLNVIKMCPTPLFLMSCILLMCKLLLPFC